jgi:arylsulfatase A-like enzyme
VVLGAGVHLARELPAWSAERSRRAEARAVPNAILIVLDTVRARSLSLYGYHRHTSPNLDAFATTGVVFERAMSTAPWTLPSHASMFTGRLPHELGADWLTPLDAQHPTLAEMFAARGYITAGFTANLLYTMAGSGLSRGFARYVDFPITPRWIAEHSWLARGPAALLNRTLQGRDDIRFRRADEINEAFFAWVAADRRAPFFAFLNYADPHEPYLPPAPHDAQFGDGHRAPAPDAGRTWTSDELQRLTDAYDGEVAYLDAEIGRLLNTLQARGLLENTLVVITADHGEQLGEHGLVDHANSLYRPLLHVPLVISFPSAVPSGVRISEPVSLVNLPATILDLTDAGGTPALPGRSLAGYWQPGARPEAHAVFAEVSRGINLPASLPASRGAMTSVVVGGMQYIRNGDGSEELYDFDRDVDESTNLAGRSDSARALEQARRALAVLAGPR